MGHEETVCEGMEDISLIFIVAINNAIHLFPAFHIIYIYIFLIG